MEFFKKTTHIDFLGQRKIAAFISGLLILASFAMLFVQGLNFGVDFTGGTIVELRYEDAVNLEEVRNTLQDSEFRGAIVQYYGAANEVLCFGVALPTSAGNGVQDATTTATFDFVAEQTANN